MRWLVYVAFNVWTKYEVSTCNRSGDIKGSENFKMVLWPKTQDTPLWG